MSASKNKKLRKEQNASKMTGRQAEAQKEAKKLKRYTVTFVSVMAIILVIAIGILTVRGVIQSGRLQSGSIAAEIGDNKLNAVELSYYYFDAIDENYSEWYETYGSNMELYLDVLLNLNINKPLDEQIYDKETGETWADKFVATAIENAKHTYVLCALAEKAGFELPEEKVSNIDVQISNLKFWSTYYGYSSISKYLGASYCYGANEDNYRRYLEMNALADAYYDHYASELKYDNNTIRDYEKDKYINYTSFSYGSVYLSYTYFLGEGTKDENGNVTYTDDERDAARAAAKSVAESLLTAKTYEELDAAVKALAINKDKTNASATNSKNTLYTAIPAIMQEWVTSADRKEGDNTVIVNKYTPEDEEDKEGEEGEGGTDAQTEDDSKGEEVINGYYVVVYKGSNENKVPMVDVRHLLVAFDGGKKNEETGKMEYSDEEKAEAKAAAEKLLKEWQETEGGATKEALIELIEKESDDEGTVENGGLIEYITYDLNYVEPFLTWALAEGRKEGDYGIIETEYGYHIMYFEKTHELNYRDKLISEDLRAEEMEKWYEDIRKDVQTSVGELKWIATDTTIASR